MTKVQNALTPPFLENFVLMLLAGEAVLEDAPVPKWFEEFDQATGGLKAVAFCQNPN